MKNTLKNSCLALSMAALSTSAQAATMLFNFTNGGDFDGSAGVGETMSVSDSGETVVMTTIDILAPEIQENSPGVFTASGTILSAAGGGNVVTSIGSSNSVGVNNLSIGNTNYLTYSGASGGAEGNDMNPGEAWVFNFDMTVMITEFNFSSIDNVGEFFDVTINGNTFSFGEGMAGDDFSDPLSGLVIAAGSNITLAARGPLDTTNIRISSLTVETVPEPSSTALLGLGGLALILRRRK